MDANKIDFSKLSLKDLSEGLRQWRMAAPEGALRVAVAVVGEFEDADGEPSVGEMQGVTSGYAHLCAHSLALVFTHDNDFREAVTTGVALSVLKKSMTKAEATAE